MSLVVRIGADTSAFKRGISTVSKDVDNLGKGIKNMGNKFMPLTYGAAGIFTAAIKAGGDFEHAMDRVSAVGQVYGKDLEELTALAKKMGLETKFSATEAADGLYYMAQAGFNASEMMGTLEPVLNLSAASGVEVARVSDIVTDALTAMGEGADQASRYVDIMAQVSSKSNTNVDLLGDTFKYASQISGTLGIKMEDLAVAIGLMANSSVKGRQAGTALRGGLVNMVKPTDKQAAAMEKYNISLIKNKDGSVNFLATMRNMRKQLKGLDRDVQANILSTIFGKEALSGWAAVVNASEADFNDMANAIQNSTGATEKMKETMLDNTKGDITIMLSSIEGALIAVFEAIAPVVTEVAKTVTELANAFGNLTPSTQKFIATALGVGALIGPFLKLTGSIVSIASKIRAIPVALSKMNDRSIERQVNAWLKWNRVSDEQAAKLRKVARDLDKVKRDGSGATTSAQRLANELKKVRMSEQPANEMKDLKQEASKAEREVEDVKREINSLKGKRVEIDVVTKNKTIGKSSKVDVKGGKKKGSGMKGVGKEIAEDLISEVSGELGASALKGIGGEIFGSIIGEGLAEGLTAAAFSGAGLKGVLAGIAGLINPVTVGIGAAGIALGVLYKHTTKSVEKLSLFETKLDSSGKKVTSFKGATDGANETLNEMVKVLSTLDEKGGIKEVGVKQDIDFKKKEEEDKKAIQDAVNRVVKIRTAEINADRTLTEKQKAEKIKQEEAKYRAVEKKMLESNARKSEYAKTWNDSFGQAQWEAGQKLVLQELELLKQSELLHATSDEEKRKIHEKYRGMEKQAVADFMVANQNTLITGLKTELQAINDNKTLKLNMLEEEHQKEMKLIAKRYKEGTPQYKKAVEEEKAKYEEKKAAIIKGAEEEKTALGEFIAKQMDAIEEMERNGQITRDECDSMIKALNELGAADQTVDLKLNDSEFRRRYNAWKNQLRVPLEQIVNVYTKNMGGAGTGSKTPPSTGYSSMPAMRRATGGAIAPRGTTLVGERGPELISRRGNQVEVQPLRATDRAMGGWNKRDLEALGSKGDTYYVYIQGHNKSAKELFDEIEEYKHNMERNVGRRRYK